MWRHPWVRRAAAVGLRVGVGVALLAFLLLRVNLTAAALAARRLSPGVALAAGAVMLLVGVVTAARWFVLLRAQGVAVPFAAAVRLTYIAVTWNLALPGGESGNLVKAALLARQQPQRAGGIWAATVVDQFSLAAGQMIVALGTLALARHPPPGIGVWLAIVAVGVVLVGLLYAAFLVPVAPERVDGVVARLSRRLAAPAWLRRMLAGAASEPAPEDAAVVPRHAPGEWLAPLWAGLTRFRHHPRALLDAALLAVAYYGVIFFAYWLAARGLGLDFSYPDVAWVTALAGIAALLPITVAGAGVREGIIVFFFTQRGVPPATAFTFALTVLALNILLGLPGLVIQIVRPRARPLGAA